MTASQLRVSRVAPILKLLDRFGMREKAGDLEDLILAYQQAVADALHLEAVIHGMVKNNEPWVPSKGPRTPDRIEIEVLIPGYPKYAMWISLDEGEPRDFERMLWHMDPGSRIRMLKLKVKDAFGSMLNQIHGMMDKVPNTRYPLVLPDLPPSDRMDPAPKKQQG